jgi:hypothetical protein
MGFDGSPPAGEAVGSPRLGRPSQADLTGGFDLTAGRGFLEVDLTEAIADEGVGVATELLRLHLSARPHRGGSLESSPMGFLGRAAKQDVEAGFERAQGLWGHFAGR